MPEQYNNSEEAANSLRAEIANLTAKVSVLEEAIKPFSLAANKWHGLADDLKMEVVWWKPASSTGGVDFYLGDLRRLSRAALSPVTGGVETPPLKIGDRVVIRERFEAEGIGWTDAMDQFIGQTATIMAHGTEADSFELDVDDENWLWPAACLDRAPQGFTAVSK